MSHLNEMKYSDCRVYVKRGTHPEPAGTTRNLPEPPGTYPEPPGTYPEPPGTNPEPTRNHPEPTQNTRNLDRKPK